MVLDHMLPPGLGRAEHIRQAKLALSPFNQNMPIDEDLHFAAEATLTWGPCIHQWREQQQQCLHRVLGSLADLRAALDQLRSSTSRAVAADRDIAGLAFYSALLRWPDRTQASGYLEGFEVVGNIESSRVFRAIPPTQLRDDFFGSAATEEVRKAMTSSPPPKMLRISSASLRRRSTRVSQSPWCLQKH